MLHACIDSHWVFLLYVYIFFVNAGAWFAALPGFRSQTNYKITIKGATNFQGSALWAFIWNPKILLSVYCIATRAWLFLLFYCRAWRRIDLDPCIKSTRYAGSCECITSTEVFIGHDTHLLLFELIKFHNVIDCTWSLLIPILHINFIVLICQSHVCLWKFNFYKMNLVKEEIQRLCGKQYQCVKGMGSLILKHTCMLASRTKLPNLNIICFWVCL